MLDVLRRNAGSWAIKIILLLIAVTFISWGVGSYSERQKEVVATVGKTEITKTELEETAAGIEKTYREVYGAAFTPEMAKALKLREQALNSLVQRTILLKEAKSLGLTATDTEVQRDIAATPAFQAGGRFSEERYRAILSSNRMTPPEYEQAKRIEITLRKMDGLLTAGAHVSESEARDYFGVLYRKVRLLVVSADPARADAPAPSEGDVALQYDRTKESYRIPARIRLLAAKFDAQAFASAVPEPPEQKVRAYYDENSDKFRTEEERLVARIVLPYNAKDKESVRKKAGEIAAEASRGKDAFEAAARKYSKEKPAAAWVTRKQAGPELADAVFGVSVDGVAGPVETPKAFVLARVNQIRFPETIPLSKIRDKAVAAVRMAEGKDAAVVDAYKAQQTAAGSRDLKAACAPYRVVPAETGWLEGKGDGSVPPAVIQDALLLQKGEVGAVKTIGDVHYVFQVAAKEDSRVPPLSDVKEKVRAALIARKKREAAQAALQKVLSSANTDRELAQAAKAAGFAAAETPFFAPLSGSDIPEVLAAAGDDMRRDILTLSPKVRVLQKAFAGGDRFIGVAFVEEKYPDASEWASKKDAFLKEMGDQKRARLLDAFLADRKRQEKVNVNADAVK